MVGRIREEMIDRLQTMVRVPLQRGGELIMSSVPASWRITVRRVSARQAASSV